MLICLYLKDKWECQKTKVLIPVPLSKCHIFRLAQMENVSKKRVSSWASQPTGILLIKWHNKFLKFALYKKFILFATWRMDFMIYGWFLGNLHGDSSLNTKVLKLSNCVQLEGSGWVIFHSEWYEMTVKDILNNVICLVFCLTKFMLI